ncbi:MAG: hypothetical protein MKZ95_08275 [Pirellulales bacterium]|nr:hypothetical protein [Pirellulales bacterium]
MSGGTDSGDVGGILAWETVPRIEHNDKQMWGLAAICRARREFVNILPGFYVKI